MTTFSGFIFDVDGVLVDSPHELAWGETLRHFMEGDWNSLAPHTTWTPTAYTSEVYHNHTSGKARREGAMGLFRYFNIPDPTGERLAQFCDAKQAMILEFIQKGQFKAYDDALRFLLKAKHIGAKLAAASSSKNANMMLAQVHPEPQGSALIELFDANVCGRDFDKGKPHPAIFLSAATELNIEPTRCVVIEDAPSGVAAAKAAGMACIGVDRLGDSNDLKRQGADWVVGTLDELTINNDLSISYR